MVKKDEQLYDYLLGLSPALAFLSSIFWECIPMRPTTKTNIPTKIINNIPYIIYLPPYFSNNNEITENIKNKIIPNMNTINLNFIAVVNCPIIIVTYVSAAKFDDNLAKFVHWFFVNLMFIMYNFFIQCQQRNFEKIHK